MTRRPTDKHERTDERTHRQTDENSRRNRTAVFLLNSVRTVAVKKIENGGIKAVFVYDPIIAQKRRGTVSTISCSLDETHGGGKRGRSRAESNTNAHAESVVLSLILCTIYTVYQD